jgi:HD-like signal output (HDOD) protein
MHENTEAATTPLDERLRAHALDPGVRLPIARRSASRIIDELDRAGTCKESLVSSLRSEPVLAANTLRLANGTEFAGLRPCDGLEDACERLGRERVERLVMSLLTGGVLNEAAPLLVDALDRAWWQALCTAAAAAWISAETGRDELSERTYLMGLLSTLGIPVLVSALEEDRLEFTDHTRAEILGQMHERLALELMSAWRLAPDLVDPIFRSPTGGRDESGLVVHLARHLAFVAGASTGCLESGAEEEEALWETADALGLSDVHVAALQVRSEDFLEVLAANGTGS